VTDPDANIPMPAGGDEFMAVKPWLGALVEPSPVTAKHDELKWELDTQLESVLRRQEAIRRPGLSKEQLKKLQVRVMMMMMMMMMMLMMLMTDIIMGLFRSTHHLLSI
jgi:hypothetical protein